MSSNLALTQATGSPSSGVSVSVSAILDYNGKLIPVNSGDLSQLLKGNFSFELTTPVALGSISDFLAWMTKEFGIPVNLDQEVQDVINALINSGIGIVQDIGNALNGIYHAVITITVLNINISKGQKTYQFGVTVTPLSPIHLFAGLSFDSIGVLIGNTGATGSPS